ncbi:hypothetical protein scyTo_0012689 [Scyliorhinus torazame]|uniref:Uncharacterized protein n=1 Tax=Scyliorhinus torazame TaxID=75743 RepID=A0A401NGW2_SCYTO|nr:hypothetical protein [Scyliorhinus torazame]
MRYALTPCWGSTLDDPVEAGDESGMQLNCVAVLRVAPIRITMRINRQLIKLELDTAAAVSVVPHHVFDRIRHGNSSVHAKPRLDNMLYPMLSVINCLAVPIKCSPAANKRP